VSVERHVKEEITVRDVGITPVLLSHCAIYLSDTVSPRLYSFHTLDLALGSTWLLYLTMQEHPEGALSINLIAAEQPKAIENCTYEWCCHWNKYMCRMWLIVPI